MDEKTFYTEEQLYDFGPQKYYDHTCSRLAFLLGGIGTGNFSVGARGQLQNWEIFGTAGKDNFMPNTFFAIWAKQEEQKPITRVLEAALQPPHDFPRGYVDYEVAGIPRFASSRARGEYPFFEVELQDEALPFEVTMESFTPFIPLNTDDSSIPTGIIRYTVTNTTAQSMEVSVVGSLSNLSALKKYDFHIWQKYQQADEVVNEYRDDGIVRGLYFHPKSLADTSLYYGTMALTTRDDQVTHKRSWLRGGWWDGLQDMWDDFVQDGHLEAESVYVQKDICPDDLNGDQTASLAVSHKIPAGESRVFEFQISWCFPNRVNSWSRELYDNVVRPKAEGLGVNAPACDAAAGSATVEGSACDCAAGTGCISVGAEEYPTVKQYYATLFKDAWQAAQYTFVNIHRLEQASRTFCRAFFSSTLPAYVLEAVADTMTVIRSTTCIRIEDGTFLAWEGCFADEGCCEGSCTHVWNYAHTIAFLFPDLERSMRRVEYGIETQSSGKMNFRTYQIWGMEGHDHVPAADGQLGTIVRLYREWKISGDIEFLQEIWPTAKKTLEFAVAQWDSDADGVLDSGLFNTYDIAFQGASSMINSIYYAALKAAAEISSYLGDSAGAQRYTSL